MTNVAPLTPPSRRVKLLRYTCVTLWLLLNSIAINSVQIFFLFTLYPIIPNYLFRRLIKHTQTAFSQVLIGLCHFFAPNELVITGESDGDWDWKRLFSGNQSSEELNKKFVVISNHLTWTDWVYIWVFAHYANASKAMKIVLKESPKYIPIMGWGMMFFEFIFLKRSWSLDKHNLINAMKRICSKRQAKEPLWLLLFPEGTVWTEDTKAKSASFAKKNDLTQPSYTLLPRSTGLYTILSHLQDTVAHMYDLTIGFSGSTPTTYPNDQYKLRSVFCDGLYPSRIFIHIRRIAISDIPLPPPDSSTSPTETNPSIALQNKSKEVSPSKATRLVSKSISIDDLNEGSGVRVNDETLDETRIRFESFLRDVFLRKEDTLKVFLEKGKWSPRDARKILASSSPSRSLQSGKPDSTSASTQTSSSSTQSSSESNPQLSTKFDTSEALIIPIRYGLNVSEIPWHLIGCWVLYLGILKGVGGLVAKVW